jgi:IclR family pca regulon transcriptional regulator
VPSLVEPRFSQSLERGLAILECFTPERAVIGVHELVGELGMGPSTVHRYVATLVQLGYLEREANRRYRLALKVTELGMSALNATGLREHARLHLAELRRDTDCTVSVAVIDGHEVMYVDRTEGLRPRKRDIDSCIYGSPRVPLHCTACGKMLLATLPDGDGLEMISSLRLVAHGPNTITVKRGLRSELHAIREQGMAIDDREASTELIALAAPIRGVDGEVVAALDLLVSASTFTVSEAMTSFSPYLIAAAARISARLGYRRAHDRG